MTTLRDAAEKVQEPVDDTALLRRVMKAMGLLGADLICEIAHHGKKDQHSIGEPCPVQSRWHDAYAALRERLGEGE